MPVNRNIGFFSDLLRKVGIFEYKNNNLIRPPMAFSDKSRDLNMLKATLSVKDSYGSSNTFHWNFHKWGDNDNKVAK